MCSLRSSPFEQVSKDFSRSCASLFLNRRGPNLHFVYVNMQNSEQFYLSIDFIISACTFSNLINVTMVILSFFTYRKYVHILRITIVQNS